MSLYDQILNTNPRYRAAMKTAHKVGSAVEGDFFDETPARSGWWLVAVGVVLVVAAKVVGLW